MPLELKEVSSGYYKGLDIVRGVSMYVEDGKVTSIIGPNGVGKSTLFKTICGFLRPTKGKIYQNGRDITGTNPYTIQYLGISYIPQLRSIFPHLTVEENLEMGGWIIRRDKKLVRERIDETYNKFPNLEEKRNMRAAFLSGGEQRMLEIARGLIIDPDVLLVDEPTGGLAPKITSQIHNSLRKLREEGKTILMVEQNIRAAIKLSDYVYVMDIGRVITEGPKEEFETKLRDLIRDWLYLK